MTLEMQQEAFSKAFVQAVCAVAGFASGRPEPDVDSVDWIVKGSVDGRASQLDIQLKCLRAGPADEAKDTFSFVLDNLKNYRDMSEAERLCPVILVVVRVPTELGAWLAMSHEQLVLAHCAYWCSLRGAPPIANQRSKTIRIPINQMFTPDCLVSMMGDVARRDFSRFEIKDSV